MPPPRSRESTAHCVYGAWLASSDVSDLDAAHCRSIDSRRDFLRVRMARAPIDKCGRVSNAVGLVAFQARMAQLSSVEHGSCLELATK
jgi:hypothetical protein